MYDKEFLTTGGSGKTGRHLTKRLIEEGYDARPAARTAPEGGVAFDWSDPSGHAAAIRGVTAAYLVAPPGIMDPLPVMSQFIDQALEAGVRRFVLLSASQLQEDGPAMGGVHGYLRRQAPEWAMLNTSWFMQNFSEGQHVPAILREGVIYSATGTGAGRVGFIDVEDIASVALRCLTGKESPNQSYLLTGPEALSYDDVARIIGDALGRPIRHVNVSSEDLSERWRRLGIPDGFADVLSQIDGLIATGAEDRTTATVQEVTGRPPTSFRQFAEGNASSWSPSTSTQALVAP